jgi:hypothetical protein
MLKSFTARLTAGTAYHKKMETRTYFYSSKTKDIFKK